MTLMDLFRPRTAPAPRTSCPFCPGPRAASPNAPLCNVCRRDVLTREGVR